MSAPIQAGPGAPHEDRSGDPPEEPEALPYRQLALIGVIVLGVFGVGIVWSTTILNETAKEQRPTGAPIGDVPREMFQYEVGIVNQRMFELDNRAEQKRADQLKRLHSWGWADGERKLAHIPIERAMELMVAEQKK